MKLTKLQRVISATIVLPVLPFFLLLYLIREILYFIGYIMQVIAYKLERFDMMVGKRYSKFNKNVILRYF